MLCMLPSFPMRLSQVGAIETGGQVKAGGWDTKGHNISTSSTSQIINVKPFFFLHTIRFEHLQPVRPGERQVVGGGKTGRRGEK